MSGELRFSPGGSRGTGASILRHPAASGTHPHEQQQGSLSIGTGALFHQELMNALTGQTEETTEINFLAALADETPSFGGEFIPQRRFWAGADRAAARDARVFL